jgi:hypothetical protein
MHTQNKNAHANRVRVLFVGFHSLRRPHHPLHNVRLTHAFVSATIPLHAGYTARRTDS